MLSVDLARSPDEHERAYERVLLAAVMAWAHREGWQRPRPQWARSADGRHEVAWELGGWMSASIFDRPGGSWRGGEHRTFSMLTESVREGIDILAALRIIPPHFSSMYAAGRASALVERWAEVSTGGD